MSVYTAQSTDISQYVSVLVNVSQWSFGHSEGNILPKAKQNDPNTDKDDSIQEMENDKGCITSLTGLYTNPNAASVSME